MVYAQACVAVGYTLAGISYITVQDDPLFRCLIPEPCRGVPAKDTSPKARKSQEVVAGFATVEGPQPHAPEQHVVGQTVHPNNREQT